MCARSSVTVMIAKPVVRSRSHATTVTVSGSLRNFTTLIARAPNIEGSPTSKVYRTTTMPQIAAVQMAPVLLDRDATLARAVDAATTAAAHGAKLVLFPEAFVPGYPLWIWSLRASD